MSDNSAGNKPGYLTLVAAAAADYVPEERVKSGEIVRVDLACPAIVASREVNGEPVARLEWERITTVLAKDGLLREADLWPLSDYCLAVADFVECEAWIQKNRGLVFASTYSTTGRSGTQYKTHPMVTRRSEARALIAKLASEFGLTPRARHSMRNGGPDDADVDPMEKALER